MNLIETLLADPKAKDTMRELLSRFAGKVWVVGSRGSGRNRPDSDIDLHITDMMETDATYDEIVAFLDSRGVTHDGDKFGAGSLIVPQQEGFEVPIEFGFWDGIPEDAELRDVNIFGVAMKAPIDPL